MRKCSASANLVDLKRVAKERRIAIPRHATARALCVLINAEQPPMSISDRFELSRKLGQGKFGQVWLAEERWSGRQVALKFVDNAAQSLVMREVSILSTLARRKCHPNVLCYGGHFDGVAKLGREKSMHFNLIVQTDFVDGQDLSRWSAQATLPSAPATQSIATGLLRALAFIHRHRIYHLDVKPANVIVRRDADNEPVLIDFGLSCAERGDKYARCETAVGYGTPGYMSPEYAKYGLMDPTSGKCGAKMYEQTDVWGAGMTLLAIVHDVGADLQAIYERNVVPHLTYGQVVRQERQFVQKIKTFPREWLVDTPETTAARKRLDAIVWSAVEQALTVDMKGRPSAATLLKLFTG